MLIVNSLLTSVVSSASELCKQFDTLRAFMKDFLEKLDFDKISSHPASES